METVIEQQFDLNQDKIILLDGEDDSDRCLAVRTSASELKGFPTHQKYGWTIYLYNHKVGVVGWNLDASLVFEGCGSGVFFPQELRIVADFLDAVGDQQKYTVQA